MSASSYSARSALARRPLRAPSARPGRAARRAVRPVRAAIADLPKENAQTKVLVVGGTGYIGKFVVRELCAQGYDVTAFVRPKSGIGGKTGEAEARALFPDATVAFGTVGDVDSIARDAFGATEYDVVVSCLASRTGGIKDSWDVDYQATKNVLDVARRNGAKHFVLLSAICVQKPHLTFQKAKLKFEEELQNAGDISYSIVRPTAFFKSLAGQVESVQLQREGAPGDGSCPNLDNLRHLKHEIAVQCLAGESLEAPDVASVDQPDVAVRIVDDVPYIVDYSKRKAWNLQFNPDAADFEEPTVINYPHLHRKPFDVEFEQWFLDLEKDKPKIDLDSLDLKRSKFSFGGIPPAFPAFHDPGSKRDWIYFLTHL